MTTLTDFKLPSYLNKKKKINLYKAFILNDGDRMSVNSNIDIFGLSYEAAVQYMLFSLTPTESADLNKKEIAFCIFVIDRSYLDMHPLVDEGDVYYDNENISITLKGKPYKFDVETKIIDSINIETNDKNEIKLITDIKFME